MSPLAGHIAASLVSHSCTSPWSKGVPGHGAATHLQKGQQSLDMGGMWRWRAEGGFGLKAVVEPGQLQRLG